MSSRQGHKGSATSLKAIVLSGLLLLSGSASASFIDHSNHQVIAEPRLINIPTAYRGHHPHGSHGHRHRARFHQKKSEGVVVEAPYTIWTGTFEDLKRRAPVAAKGDTTTETKDSTSTDTASEDDACTGIVCPKGYYCTKDGCCPDGKKCTGVKTCLDATDSECPDNIACCPKGSPVCRVNNGQGVCMKGKQQEDPTTTSESPKPTSTKVTKADPTTTSEPPKPTSTKVTKADVTTSTTSEPETKEASTSTTDTTTSSSEQTSATPPPAAVPTDSGVATPEPSPIPVDTPSTTLAAPTPSSTAKNREPSGSTKIISSAVAGSIVALAFGTLIIYTIVKKRKENALARAEEASKAAPMSAPTSAAPMGSGGNGRPLSIQPEPEMLHMSPQAPAAVFTSGPQRGMSLRDGIPPPSPPPNAMVVGTPPYRREQYRVQPGTPTSLRAGVPGPQIAQPWNPVERYDNNYQQNFPFPEEAHDAGYHASGSYPPEGSHTPGAHTPSTGSYQAYSPPSTPMYAPGTARSSH